MNELEQALVELLKYPVRVELMRKKKKDDYWGMSIQHYVTDGEGRYGREGTIQIDSRVDDKKLRDIVVHETKHLSDETLQEEVIEKAIEGINIRECLRKRKEIRE